MYIITYAWLYKYILAKKHQDAVKKERNLLRLLIFLPIFLLSQETFLLPDEADHLMNQLNTHIKQAEKEVLIFTPHLDDYLFIKNLKSIAKKKVPIVIITQDPISKENQVLRLSLFNNISIFTLKPFSDSMSVKGSLVCIDDQRLFLLSGDINRKEMKNTYSFSVLKEQPCNTLLQTLLSRSNLY